MAGLPYLDATQVEEVHKHIRTRLMVKECVGNYMSKDETYRYLQSRYHFTRQDINRAWDFLERDNPDSFRLHTTSSPQEGNSSILGRQEQQQRLSPPPPPPRARRPLWNSPNVTRYAAASPQEAASNANANAVENQNPQASLQPAFPNDIWQQILNTLDQIQSNTQHMYILPKIQSNTEQLVKLLLTDDDGHGFGPHPSAAGSSKRQRLGEDGKKRGGDGETEKKEEGNDKEADKNERGVTMKK